MAAAAAAPTSPAGPEARGWVAEAADDRRTRPTIREAAARDAAGLVAAPGDRPAAANRAIRGADARAPTAGRWTGGEPAAVEVAADGTRRTAPTTTRIRRRSCRATRIPAAAVVAAAGKTALTGGGRWRSAWRFFESFFSEFCIKAKNLLFRM